MFLVFVDLLKVEILKTNAKFPKRQKLHPRRTLG